MAKTFKGRLINKHDIGANWKTASDNGFIPLDGELILYDDLNKIKMGDGTTKVHDLPFLFLDEDEIQGLIEDNLETLNYTDVPFTDEYVTGVTQSNGLIQVEKHPIPTAGANTLGIVKGFHRTSGTATGTKTTNATNAPAVNARSTRSDRYYGVETDATGAMYVNVPWSNSDTKVKQTARTSAGEFPILVRGTSAGTGTTTGEATFRTLTTLNPSNGIITTTDGTSTATFGPEEIVLTDGTSTAVYDIEGVSLANDTSTAIYNVDGIALSDDIGDVAIGSGLVAANEIFVASDDQLQNISISPQSLDVKGSSLEEKVSISSSGIEMVNSSGNSTALYTDTSAGRGAWLAQGATVYHPGSSGTLALTSDIPTITTGTANGTISVDGTNIPVKGLGSNAYSSATYAGGTKVTLNGSSKGGSTATFYAPTTSGTSGQVLKSNGSGKIPTWVDGANLVAPKKITLVATAGQTAFNIPFEYDSLSSNLTVYFNGILMKETDNYTVDTTNNTVNLAGFSAEANDVVTIMGLLGAQSIDFGQEAIDAINLINMEVARAEEVITTVVNEAKDEIDDAAEEAIDNINNLKASLPPNWEGFLTKTSANVMESGGKITMNSNYTPSGNYDVTTKTYVDSAISTATSAIVTDIYKASSTAPTNTKLLWIDTKNSNILKYHNGSAWTPVVVAWA